MADIVQVAKQQIGLNESSGSADKFTTWYYGRSSSSRAIPWCAIFVSWCANQAGIMGSSVPKFAACNSGKSWYSSKGKYQKSKGYGGSYKPAYGDIIFFSGGYTQGNSTHVGIVVSASDSQITTIEGNTSNSVKQRSYSAGSKYIIGYGVTGVKESSSTGSSSSSVGGGGEKKKVDITKVVQKSVSGGLGTKDNSLASSGAYTNYGNEILIQNDKIYFPSICNDITLEYERKGSPGTLKFDVIQDKVLNITEGNPVRFRSKGQNVFYGYIFSKERKEKGVISVTCYDQLRYLQNKDTLAYKNKRYSDLLKTIADMYGLKLGTVETTPYVIPAKIEECALIDMLLDASDLTVLNTGKLYVLYDDFGKLCLRNIESMLLPVLVDKDSAVSLKYTSTIDKDVYNRIVLARDNDTTGERETYVSNATDSQKAWGVLTYYENVDITDTRIITERRKALMKYYNRKQRTLSVEKNYGDVRVRGGSSVIVKLDLGDIKVQNYMVVEKVRHVFSLDEHTMDLDLSGIRGEFNV